MADIEIKIPLRIAKATNKSIIMLPGESNPMFDCKAVIPLEDVVGKDGIFDFGAYNVSGSVEVVIKFKAIKAKKKKK